MTGVPKVYSGNRGRFATLVEVRQRGVARPLDLRFLAPLKIDPPTGARLGEPLDFVVHVQAPQDLSGLYLDQSDDAGDQGETQQLEIVRAKDGLVHVRGTPMVPGRVTFTISAGFADGAIATGEVEAQVRPPAQGPDQLCFKTCGRQ